MATDNMAAASGGANRLHYPFNSFSWVSLPETSVNSSPFKEFSPDEIAEIMELVIPRLVCDDTSLSKDTILAFRREERNYFLKSLDDLIHKLESLPRDDRKGFADKWAAKEHRRIRLPATCLNTLVMVLAAYQLGLSNLLEVIGGSLLWKGLLTREVPGIAEDARVFGKRLANLVMRRIPLLRKAGEAYASLLRKWE
jgi:hypothetical protein